MTHHTRLNMPSASLIMTMTMTMTMSLGMTLTGCVQTTPKLDQQFGNSVRSAVAAQQLNPNAVRDNRAVEGIDGRSAVAIQKRYQGSYDTPAEAEAPMTTGKK